MKTVGNISTTDGRIGISKTKIGTLNGGDASVVATAEAATRKAQPSLVGAGCNLSFRQSFPLLANTPLAKNCSQSLCFASTHGGANGPSTTATLTLSSSDRLAESVWRTLPVATGLAILTRRLPHSKITNPVVALPPVL
jgi:hypothetical protein